VLPPSLRRDAIRDYIYISFHKKVFPKCGLLPNIWLRNHYWYSELITTSRVKFCWYVFALVKKFSSLYETRKFAVTQPYLSLNASSSIPSQLLFRYTFQNCVGLRLPCGHLRADFSMERFPKEVMNCGLLTIIKRQFLSDKRINKG
jgi:hypothetical protein